MKRLTALALVVVLGGGCAGKTPPQVLSPTAFSISATATNTIVIALSALQTAAIALASVDGFTQAETTAVVNTVALIIPIVQAAQTGWVSTIDVLFAKLPAQLSPATQATLGPWIAAIEGAITGAYGTGLS